MTLAIKPDVFISLEQNLDGDILIRANDISLAMISTKGYIHRFKQISSDEKTLKEIGFQFTESSGRIIDK